MVTFNDAVLNIRRVASKEEVAELVEAAKLDNHALMFPSHIIRKGGRIAGYFSINRTPIINVWLSTTELKARDTVNLFGSMEMLAAESGLTKIIMPCAETSPLYPLMPHMGFANLGKTTINFKNL